MTQCLQIVRADHLQKPNDWGTETQGRLIYHVIPQVLTQDMGYSKYQKHLKWHAGQSARALGLRSVAWQI